MRFLYYFRLTTVPVFYFKERNTELGVVDLDPETLIFRVLQTTPISVFYFKERTTELGVVDLDPDTLIFSVLQTTPFPVVSGE